MRAPDDSAAAVELRDGLTALLHWDGLPGLHSTGLAQWQMWILAQRTGHLQVRRPSRRTVREATRGSAQRTPKRTAGGGRGKASAKA